MATSTATPAATTADGEEGLAQALDGQYDVLIVDRRLPKLDGLTVIGSLRSKGIETPALILSALGQIDDRVKGLRAAATIICPSPIRFRSCWRARRCWRGGAAAARKRSIASATSSSTA
jgi:two-component system OmpR family response regulator